MRGGASSAVRPVCSAAATSSPCLSSAAVIRANTADCRCCILLMQASVLSSILAYTSESSLGPTTAPPSSANLASNAVTFSAKSGAGTLRGGGDGPLRSWLSRGDPWAAVFKACISFCICEISAKVSSTLPAKTTNGWC